MGARWSAMFFTEQTFDAKHVCSALQAAVTEIDDQMSTWKPDSDLARINAAPVGHWIEAPARLIDVLRLGLAVGRASAGAFDVGLGDAVMAWGFGPAAVAGDRIRAAMAAKRRPAWEALDVEAGRLRKCQPVTLDFNGIAKGYGVDRLAETLAGFGITSFLAGINGEMRASGLRPDGQPWTIAIEQPDHARRAVHSVLALHDAAVATSGDYRHWVDVRGRRLSHTMDPGRGAPLPAPPASVTVVAPTCAEADAWATALMVAGPEDGVVLAERHELNALFLLRDDAGGVRPQPVGRLFSGETAAVNDMPSSVGVIKTGGFVAAPQPDRRF
jgi:thiamine biosynthesis lipoprotein